MPLPKVKHPLFELNVPSLGKKVNFRPYLGAEEKILLTAKESGDPNSILLSLKQVIQNCMQEELDIDDFATYDLEYLFLKLRAISVDNVVSIKYIDKEDEEEYTFNVDLNEVEMLQESEIDPIIKIDEESGIVMRHPTLKILDNLPDFKTTTEEFGYLLQKCVVQLFDGETVYPMSEVSSEEFDEWVDSLPVPILTKMKQFLQSAPKMFYELKYETKAGEKRTITLRSLSDFFILG